MQKYKKVKFFHKSFVFFIDSMYFCSGMNERQLINRLAKTYDEREARAIIRMVLEVRFGLTLTDIACGGIEKMNDEETLALCHILSSLEQGMPVQYVLGMADFGPRTFLVEPGVLIPRPETYELCQMVVEDIAHHHDFPPEIDILDIGTGSGCIAITLALDIPQAHVTAWDIMPEALRIAERNAQALSAHVTFEQRDVLSLSSNPSDTSIPRTSRKSRISSISRKSSLSRDSRISRKSDIIISNPPYISRHEQAQMERHVVEHEPEIALFVPDDDPLVFYRHIAHYAQEALSDGGRLYFEINPLYAEPLVQMMSAKGWHDISRHQDQYGKTRFMKCKK